MCIVLCISIIVVHVLVIILIKTGNAHKREMLPQITNSTFKNNEGEELKHSQRF